MNPLLHERAGAVSVVGTSGTALGLDMDGAPLGNAPLPKDRIEDSAIAAAIAEVAPRTNATHGLSSDLARAMVPAASPETLRTVILGGRAAGFTVTVACSPGELHRMLRYPSGYHLSNDLEQGTSVCAHVEVRRLFDPSLSPNIVRRPR